MLSKKLSSLFTSLLLFISLSNEAFSEKHVQPASLVKEKTIVWMKKNAIPGTAVALYNKGVPHVFYFGYANLENKAPVTGHTLFEIGSLTKLFTTLLLAKEVNTKNLRLDDSVAQYLPILKANSAFKSITLEELATYTAGLPFTLPDNIKTNNDFYEFLLNWQPSSTKKPQWAYSNLSTGLLGYALEKKANHTIDNLYQNEIFDPLRMSNIGIIISSKKNAQGYNEQGEAVPFPERKLLPAAGKLNASTNAMLKFLAAAIGHPHIPNDITKAIKLTQTAFFEVNKAKQGLAWTIYPFSEFTTNELLSPPDRMNLGPISAKHLAKATFYEEALIEKTGATDGFRAYMAVIPSKRVGIVIMANRYVSNGEILKIGREILLNL